MFVRDMECVSGMIIVNVIHRGTTLIVVEMEHVDQSHCVRITVRAIIFSKIRIIVNVTMDGQENIVVLSIRHVVNVSKDVTTMVNVRELRLEVESEIHIVFVQDGQYGMEIVVTCQDVMVEGVVIMVCVRVHLFTIQSEEKGVMCMCVNVCANKDGVDQNVMTRIPRILTWNPRILSWNPRILSWNPRTLSWNPRTLSWNPRIRKDHHVMVHFHVVKVMVVVHMETVIVMVNQHVFVTMDGGVNVVIENQANIVVMRLDVENRLTDIVNSIMIQ